MRGLGSDGCRGAVTNPEASVALRRPARVCSPQRDCVVPLPHSQVCSGPRPLGRSGAEKGAVLSGGRGDGRDTGMAWGDSRPPSPVQHSFPCKTVEQSKV